MDVEDILAAQKKGPGTGHRRPQRADGNLGAVRETKRGFDAFATTTGYDPGRATKGLASMEEAKAFVESFEPWSLYEGGDEALPIESEVRARETA